MTWWEGCTAVGRFLEARTEKDSAALVPVAELVQEYKEWARRTGWPDMGDQALAEYLHIFGYVEVKGPGRRWYWKGFRLRKEVS